MNRHLVLFLSIILLILQNVSSNPLEINEVKEESDPTKNLISEANDFRRMVEDNPGRILAKFSKPVTKGDVEALRQALRSSPIDWQQFTPPPNAIDEPNCMVEVQVIQKMPGKCNKLKGGIPICQAQNFVSIDYNTCK